MSEVITKETTEVAHVAESPIAPVLQMIERLVVNPDADIDKLERMVAMQERMLNRDAEIAFNEAMRAAQSEMPSIRAISDNNQTNSKYAKLDNINRAIVPVYTNHGFSMSYDTAPSELDGCVKVIAILSHSQGHTRKYHYDLPMDKAGIAGKVNKTDIHARASSITYGQRYLTTLIWNLAIGNDVDGNQTQEAITEDQRQTLIALADEVKADMTKFLAYFKLSSLDEMPASWYDRAVKALEAKR